jgi:predicted MFS family arabinose efflux permease
MSNVLGAMGNQTEVLVLGWLVLVTTDSPLYLGLVTAARLGLNPMALFAGAIADRVPRQLLLAAVEFIMGGLALVMLALILGGYLEVWHIFAITLAGGLARIFQMPAVQSLAADSVSQDKLANGVALTTMGMNLTLIFGPLLGGILFETMGPEGAYGLISGLHLLGGFCALLVRVPRLNPSRAGESVFRAVLEGLKYVKRHQPIWGALLVAAFINFSGFPFHTALLPVFARDVLGTGSAGLGLLMSAFGVGALVGSLALASVENLKNAGKLLVLAVVVWHASMLVFSLSTSFPVSLAILLVTGAVFSSTLVLIVTVMFRVAQPEFRGRIMGLRVLAISAHTFGSINSGAIAGIWGAPWAASVNGLIGIAMVGITALLAPQLRRS